MPLRVMTALCALEKDIDLKKNITPTIYVGWLIIHLQFSRLEIYDCTKRTEKIAKMLKIQQQTIPFTG